MSIDDNPYDAPKADLNVAVGDSEETPRGIGRLLFIPLYLGLGAAMVSLDLTGEAAWKDYVVILVGVGLLVVLAQRIANVGFSRWWTLGMLVPLLNLVIGLMALAAPPGYRHHRTADRAAMVIAGLVIASVVIPVILVLLL